MKYWWERCWQQKTAVLMSIAMFQLFNVGNRQRCVWSTGGKMLTAENSSTKRKTSAWANLSTLNPKCVDVTLNQGPRWIDGDHQPKTQHAILVKLTVLYHTICSSTKRMVFWRKMNNCIEFLKLSSHHSRTVIEVITCVTRVLTVFFEPYVTNAERNFTDVLCVLV